MKSWILGLLAAGVLHLAVLLFGGIFFLGDDDASQAKGVEEVDILAADAPDEKKDVEQELEKREADEVQAEPEKPPDMQQLVELEQQQPATLADATPGLDALSLEALESALGGAAFDGDFGSSLSLASGGRIGGAAAAGAGVEQAPDAVFDITEIDQQARPLFQSAPVYPLELRRRKVEGTVLVQFIVDAKGHVVSPTIESATHPEFERPALDAVRQWKFEPAVRSGQKVSSKMRVPIRFTTAG